MSVWALRGCYRNHCRRRYLTGTLVSRIVLCDICTRHCPRKYSAAAINYYDVLEVTPKSSQRHIKSSYYRLSKRYHPDVNKEPNAKLKFSQISEAYEVLSNVNQRRLYDQGLLNREGSGGAPFHYDDFAKKGFKKRAAPPTGRSHIYNFDEFYRQHYGDAINKKQAYNQGKDAYDKQSKEMQLRQKYMVLGYIMTLVGLIATIAMKKRF